MEYKLVSTINGPVLQAEDEIIFFHQFGPLQDYIDEDSEFFSKAYAFIAENMREQSDSIIKSLTQDVVGNDWVNQFNLFYNAFQNLRHFQSDTAQNNQGFPGI